MNFRDGAIEHMHAELAYFAFPQEVENEKEELRQKFTQYFNQERLRVLMEDEYYLGMGRKSGCMAYELEWGTIVLGSIKGGSNLKFGYKEDFEKIKALLIDLSGFEGKVGEFYLVDGQLTPKMDDICQRSRKINGFKTGRTVLPKLLSIYYPTIFLPIFNDADTFLDKILLDYVPETTGLELYLQNNYLLNKIMEQLDEISEEDLKSFSGYKFMEYLYHCFPKESRDALPGSSDVAGVYYDDPEFEALEVEHYQSLIHRNFSKLFPELVYFEEETQKPKNGQYDTQTVGIIDFLAVEIDSGDFVVIELKRRATDRTIGQLARYMGWVQEELCKKDQKVKGMVVAERGDIYLEFALNAFPNVKFRRMVLDIQIDGQ